MAETLLSEPDQKEALSKVYVRALAARAGYDTSKPEFDRDSVDLRIQAGGDFRPALDLQLKATTQLHDNQENSLPFRLPIKNYRDLRGETQTPRILVILRLPKDRRLWMSVSDQELVLRRRAYWLSLQQGYEEINNQKTVTVHIPAQNVLDVKTLQNLMKKSRTGEI